MKLSSFFPLSKWVLTLLVVAIALNVYNTFSRLSYEALDFDAVHFYLPFAKQFLAEGLSFFHREESVHYGPLAYLYPALFGANPVIIKLANIVLSCLVVVMVYRIGSLLHSPAAGITAAFMYALSPSISELTPTVLTEPVYFFFTGLWLWAVTKIVVNGKRSLIPAAGIAFGLAILTRGTFIYFLGLVMLISLVLAMRESKQREAYSRLFWVHVIAAVFPIILILKNWIVFDYPFIATGAGNALYFGSHPLVYGYEMPYFGLGYDQGAVTHELDHLSIAGDRLLNGVALTVLADRHWDDLISAYWQKTMAFIFVTKAVLPDTLFNIRSLRIAEVVLSVIGLFSLRNRIMQWLIGGAIGYQIAVHVPVLYTHRYSVGALDLWLVLLSAIGVAQLLYYRRWSNTILKPVAVLVLILAAVGIGEWHRKHSAPLSPNILGVPHDDIWVKNKNDLVDLSTTNMTLLESGVYRLSDNNGSLMIPVRGVLKLNSSGNYVLSLAFSVTVPQRGDQCQGGRVSFKRLVDGGLSDALSIPFKINSENNVSQYHFGATLALALISDGELTLDVSCPKDAVVDIEKIWISEPHVAGVYRERYLQKVLKIK